MHWCIRSMRRAASECFASPPPGFARMDRRARGTYRDKKSRLGRDSSTTSESFLTLFLMSFLTSFLTRRRDAGGPGFRCPLRCSAFGHPFFADRIGLAAGHFDRVGFSDLAARIDCLAARIVPVVRPAGGSVPYHLP